MKSFASFKSEGKDCRVRGDCIGPEAGGSLTVNERLIVPLVTGFGCLHYTDNYDKLSIGDFGVHLDIGRESRTPTASASVTRSTPVPTDSRASNPHPVERRLRPAALFLKKFPKILKFVKIGAIFVLYLPL